MSKILNLREKRANLWDKAKNYLKEHEREDGTLSAEDNVTYSNMEKEIIDLGKDIERLERAEALEKEMSMPTSEPIVGKPGAVPKDEKTGRASDSYRNSFWNAIRNKNFIDVRNDLSIGTDANGGFLVPDEYERTLVQALEEENFFRRIAKIIYTDSGERAIPVVTAHGEASWLDEGAAFTTSDETFEQITLGAYKVGTMIKVSQELLNDSVFDLESYIAAEFARRIGAKEEEAFLVGDGSKKPTGVFTSADDGVNVSGTAIKFDDIMDLVHSLKSVYRRKAAFVLHDSSIKAIRKLKDANGQYIWNPSVREGEPDRILSYPYYTSRFAPEIETEKSPILFGDFSYYWIADRQSRSFQRLNELYATNGQVGFLAYQRVDGKLTLTEAVKKLTISE